MYGVAFPMSEAAMKDDWVTPFGQAKIERTGQHISLVTFSGEGEPHTPPSAGGPLDLAHLRKANPDRASLQELLELFRMHAPGRIAKLRPALEAQDAEGLRAAAHALKGSCAYLYATELTRLCGELEEAAALARFQAAGSILLDLEQAFVEVEAALDGLASELAPEA